MEMKSQFRKCGDCSQRTTEPEYDVKVHQKSFRKNSPKFYLPKRYIVIFMGFLSMFNVYALRTNLSVAIVAMVKQPEILAVNSSTLIHVSECVSNHKAIKEDFVKFKGEKFDWNSRVQDEILGSFFYGYILTQLPGGVLSEKFGFKWILGGGIFVAAFVSLLTPLAAGWSTAAVIVIRVIEGLTLGVTSPAMNITVSKWVPKVERSRASTFMHMGAQVGNVIALCMSGWLSDTDFLGGWPSAFYVFGAVGCIWFLFWSIFISENPSSHSSISIEEKQYIQQDYDENSNEFSPVPWKKIFTSMPMWAAIFGHLGHNFGYLVLMTEMPTYLSTILHFDLKENGFLSALPFIVQTVTGCLASYMADKLLEHKKMSLTAIRKLCNSIGLFGPAICLIGVSLSGCHSELTVTLFTLALAINGFAFSGFNVIHVDMSPEYSGTTYGITNAISNVSGIIGPMIVGIFTAQGATIAHWKNVFYIAASIYTLGGIVFLMFASAELQNWRQEQSNEKHATALRKCVIRTKRMVI